MKMCSNTNQREETYSEIPFVLTVEEAAKILNVGKNTAYALVNSGLINSVRVGRQIRICRAELFRYLGVGDSA